MLFLPQKVKKLSLTLFFFIACLPFFFAQDFNFKSTELNETLTDNATSCIRLSSTKIRVESQDKLIVKHRHVITVLNKYGNADVDAFLHYDDNIAVKKLEAIVYDKGGKEIKKIKKNDFKDVSAVDGGTLYSDSRVYYLEYTPLDYPYTVEFSYELKNSSTAFVRPWRPIRNYKQSVEKSEFEIIDNTQAQIRVNKKNLDFIKGIIVDESINRIYCKAQNIPALKREDYSPSLSTFSPKVQFALSQFTLEGVKGEATTWQDMGKWQYNELLLGRDEVDDDTKQEILQLTAGVEHPLEKAKLVYKFVQDRTRYISVQVGIGGWQPIKASEVDEVKYGDCKGLTNYTKALLKVAGVESNYVVVYAGGEKEDIDKDFASMQGNHVILQVPLEEEKVWLECTSQDIPFGFLGSFTDDRDVLVINEEGGKIERTVKYVNDDNYQKITSRVKLNKDQQISGNTTITSTGSQYYGKYHMETMPKNEILKLYKSYYGQLQNLKFTDIDFENDKNTVEFQENFSFTADNFTSKFGNRFMFSPNIFNQSIGVPDKYNDRKSPFVITRGFFDEDEIIYELPTVFKVESSSKPIKIESKFGTYVSSLKVSETGDLIYKRSFRLNSGAYEKEDYENFREFMKNVNKADGSKVILLQKT